MKAEQLPYSGRSDRRIGVLGEEMEDADDDEG